MFSEFYVSQSEDYFHRDVQIIEICRNPRSINGVVLYYGYSPDLVLIYLHTACS